ncbi:uncharacterized protein ANIA_11301 [Aspergillus nidulans FGSC A4]|uniref:Uncharacterized protein n=1 Tax=Emericella nidulans (strain FGSC A4 / ATCC 38163 / CBS 112.46 / NRRL 194 / M139) TaxID=227321 RepID=C8VM32_EMENI|nr:hypothetical protein [Aspergillus nidulans FGSC A4]CBF84819.1 TPA: hypothetical protein ANIA_11301 [Aspergillus nidulans FGSC A4]
MDICSRVLRKRNQASRTAPADTVPVRVNDLQLQIVPLPRRTSRAQLTTSNKRRNFTTG